MSLGGLGTIASHATIFNVHLRVDSALYIYVRPVSSPAPVSSVLNGFRNGLTVSHLCLPSLVPNPRPTDLSSLPVCSILYYTHLRFYFSCLKPTEQPLLQVDSVVYITRYLGAEIDSIDYKHHCLRRRTVATVDRQHHVRTSCTCRQMHVVWHKSFLVLAQVQQAYIYVF